jgi:hypothetical protein
VAIWAKSSSERGNSQCKGLEALLIHWGGEASGDGTSEPEKQAGNMVRTEMRVIMGHYWS